MAQLVSTARGRAGVVLGAVGGAFALGAVLPPDGAGIPLCPFRAATGVPCPLCGATRATVALAHGDWSAAVAQNVVWPVVLLLLALGAAVVLARPAVVPRLVAATRGKRVLVPIVLVTAVAWAWGLAHAGTIAPPG